MERERAAHEQNRPAADGGRAPARCSRWQTRLSTVSFSLVLCSPLRRARETCELAGLGAAAVIFDDLHEWDYGDYEGLTSSQIHERDPDWSLWRDGCPSGESPAQVAERADRVLDRLRSADGDAIAFAHGHILRVVGARWIRMEVSAGGRLALGAGSVSVLGYEHENEVLKHWNT